MFNRKIEKYIEDYLESDNESILCIDGARQIGKSYIIRYLCQKHYENYIEINMIDDFNGTKIFADVKNINDFYLQLSVIYGKKLHDRTDTIIFIDEIQIYPHLITMLKALRYDNRYRYICSGSLLGIALKKAISIPLGSIIEKEMYPMDFEEFLWATGAGRDYVNYLRDCFKNKIELSDSLHKKTLDLFKTYLYVGGLPDAVKAYVETKNVYNIRTVQNNTYKYYCEDASKYDKENSLKTRRIYEYLSSNIENKVKRIQFSKIENDTNSKFKKYENEFDYLICSGITLDVKGISEPRFPLIQSAQKNLIKLYLNDVGILTCILYGNNINAILKDEEKVNLGAVYENVVAQELKAHGHKLFYYDRRKVGEVDYLIDDYDTLSVVPIEVKSCRGSYEFSALKKLMDIKDSNIKKGYVFSNKKEIKEKGNIYYLPIYFIMFL